MSWAPGTRGSSDRAAMKARTTATRSSRAFAVRRSITGAGLGLVEPGPPRRAPRHQPQRRPLAMRARRTRIAICPCSSSSSRFARMTFPDVSRLGHPGPLSQVDVPHAGSPSASTSAHHGVTSPLTVHPPVARSRDQRGPAPRSSRGGEPCVGGQGGLRHGGKRLGMGGELLPGPAPTPPASPSRRAPRPEPTLLPLAGLPRLALLTKGRLDLLPLDPSDLGPMAAAGSRSIRRASAAIPTVAPPAQASAPPRRPHVPPG